MPVPLVRKIRFLFLTHTPPRGVPYGVRRLANGNGTVPQTDGSGHRTFVAVRANLGLVGLSALSVTYLGGCVSVPFSPTSSYAAATRFFSLSPPFWPIWCVWSSREFISQLAWRGVHMAFRLTLWPTDYGPEGAR